MWSSAPQKKCVGHLSKLQNLRFVLKIHQVTNMDQPLKMILLREYWNKNEERVNMEANNKCGETAVVMLGCLRSRQSPFSFPASKPTSPKPPFLIYTYTYICITYHNFWNIFFCKSSKKWISFEYTLNKNELIWLNNSIFQDKTT